ncbi:molybdopterin molybdenumtransferase MoeA [Sphingobium jiangsuense]|uniref:Molybdopterin molybdenumtransferase n=1 Tax=Sphingobium jiangsuense TaxID=870476 RepID=A0A7W6BNE4_9SPHN|nr:gephyrin-like molybdotransferase Glp [Sphingobium jiangsuense]MBB3924909.1 molybdopterin molybdotransferase [Sphingobium jiangsuense]GLS99593.1 molybdopterin molybdenumtransferase MoeA [Sphingobium jiangsuense]
MALLPVAEAQARLLAMAAPLPPEETALAETAGRWVTREVGALRSQPAADLSAMDGYAIRHADLPGPWTVIGESAAGAGFGGAVAPGEAVRIYTGAPMPPGADCVVIQEEVTREGQRLTLSGEEPGYPGRNVRKAGSDFSEGFPILPTGTFLTARHVALTALAGHGALRLPRRPRIALVSTGSELVPPGAPLRPGQLPASNAVMLQAMLSGLPCETSDCGIIADDLATLTGCFRDLDDHDIIVSTGGASVGDHDLVKPALEAAGGSIDFWKIRMRPGKPLICGMNGKALFLGLPGNPVSAFVTAHLFLLPLVRHMAGCPAPLPDRREAVLGADMPAVGGRDDYVRAAWDAEGRIRPLTQQDSAATLGLSMAEALILRPAASPAARAGESVAVLPI